MKLVPHQKKIQTIKIQEPKQKEKGKFFTLIIRNWAGNKDLFIIIMGIILHISSYRHIVHIVEETNVNALLQIRVRTQRTLCVQAQ